MKLIIGLILTICSTVVGAEQAAEVSLDRAWGLLIGDELTLQVVLPESIDNIDQTSMPQTEKRYGTWLYLKDVTSSGKNMTLRFQVVNVPSSTTKVQTPELNLRQLDDEWIVIPKMSFILGSLLAEDDGEEINVQLKEDHMPTLIVLTEYEKNLNLFGLLSLFCIAVLLIWHLGWRPKNRQPFAQAVYELSLIKWSRTKQQNQASRILHAAFNKTAGTVIVYGELSQLTEHVPWLKPLEQDIGQFYSLSANHFFAQTSEQEPSLNDVLKLAKACRAKEKLA